MSVVGLCCVDGERAGDNDGHEAREGGGDGERAPR